VSAESAVIAENAVIAGNAERWRGDWCKLGSVDLC
jgi:hypothetical protein